MIYEVAGFFFLGEDTYRLPPHSLRVGSWEDAHEKLHQAGIDRYLITLIEVKE